MTRHRDGQSRSSVRWFLFSKDFYRLLMPWLTVRECFRLLLPVQRDVRTWLGPPSASAIWIQQSPVTAFRGILNRYWSLVPTVITVGGHQPWFDCALCRRQCAQRDDNNHVGLAGWTAPAKDDWTCWDCVDQCQACWTVGATTYKCLRCSVVVCGSCGGVQPELACCLCHESDSNDDDNVPQDHHAFYVKAALPKNN